MSRSDRALAGADGGTAAANGTPPHNNGIDQAAASFEALRRAPPGNAFVVAQLGQSLDGRIATLAGDSRDINRSAGLDHLHRLRAHVDAVVVGVGTIIADDPQLTVRRVAGRSPARVVIDPSGRLPGSARILNDDGVRRLVVRGEAGSTPPGAEIVVVPRTDGALRPTDILAALFARGFRRILIEGGARTVSAFVEAGAVDRLHILVSPVIIGSGLPGLALPPIARLAEALRPPTQVHLLADGDVLFDCDLRKNGAGS